MMANRRAKPNLAEPLADRSASVALSLRSYGYKYGLSLFFLIWLVIWLVQPLYDAGDSAGPHPRWHLVFASFLVPDEVFSAWIDGSVSAQGIVDRLRVVLIVAVVTLPTAFLGWGLLSLAGILERLKFEERVLACLAAGLALHATFVLGLGLACWIRSIPLLSLLEAIAGVVLLVCCRRRSVASFDPNLLKRASRYPLPASLSCIALFIVALRCLMPSNEFDVLEYHLGAPKQWFLEGQISFEPNNIYANMPMAAEVQTLSAMAWCEFLGVNDSWWWGAASGKVMLIVYWVISLGVPVCLTHRVFGSRTAWWLLALSVSGLALVEVTALGLIESAVAANFSAAGLMLYVHRKHLHENRVAVFWVGLFCGAAFACKYPALLFVCMPIGFLAAWQHIRLRPSPVSIPVGAAIFLAGTFMTAGPWLLKNWLLAGNPVYPLAAKLFGGDTLSTDKIQQWNAAHAVPELSISSLLESMHRLAWSWHSQDALTLPLALVGLVSVRHFRLTRIVAVLAVTGLAGWWFLSHHLYRFLLPIMPVFLVLAASGIRILMQTLGRRISVAILLVGIICNLILLAGSPTLGDSRLFVDLEAIREEGLVQSDSNRVPKHVLWVNRNLQDESTLLLVVGDAAIFNYEVPLIYSTCFDESQLADIAFSHERASWAKEFADRKITHILVHWGEIGRYRSPGNYGFDERITPELLQEMVSMKIIKPMETGNDRKQVQVFQVTKSPSQPN